MKETVLWTNPSPTSGFTQQSVTLSDNFTNYNYIKVTWAYSISSTTSIGINIYEPQQILPLQNPGQTLTLGFMRTVSNNVTYSHWRGMCGVKNVTNQIIIQSCNRLHSGTLDTNNNAVIPLTIVGCKVI